MNVCIFKYLCMKILYVGIYIQICIYSCMFLQYNIYMHVTVSDTRAKCEILCTRERRGVHQVHSKFLEVDQFAKKWKAFDR
jgi:hypothetical protein